MNFKFRITKYLAVSALAVLLLGACSKNNIYMDVAYPNGEENSDGEEGNNDNPDKKDALITFSASVEGRNITRAMSPMGKGLQSWLCAYPSNTTNTIEGEPVGEGNYITSSPGVLTGIQSYKMYLSNDIYSFMRFPVIPATPLLPLPTASPKHYPMGWIICGGMPCIRM